MAGHNESAPGKNQKRGANGEVAPEADLFMACSRPVLRLFFNE